MYFAGLVLFVLLYVLAWFIGIGEEPYTGIDGLFAHLDSFAFAYIFLGIAVHVHVYGKNRFFPGLRGLLFSPKEANPEISGYFRRLIHFTLLLGVIGLLIGFTGSVVFIRRPDMLGFSLVGGMFSFMYACWVSLLVFWPLSNRFALPVRENPGKSGVSRQKSSFPIALTLLGIAAYFLIRGLMSVLMISLMIDYSLNPPPIFVQWGEVGMILFFSVFTFLPSQIFDDRITLMGLWDLPSLLLIVFSLGLFRMMAGKLRNQRDWIPISLLFGFVWTFLGMLIILGNADPRTLGASCTVAFLTTLYGIIAAFLFVVNNRRFTLIFFLFLPVFAMSGQIPVVLADVSSGKMSLGYGVLFFVYYIAFLIPFTYFLVDGILKIYVFLESGSKKTTAVPLSEEEEQARSLLEKAIERGKTGESDPPHPGNV